MWENKKVTQQIITQTYWSWMTGLSFSHFFFFTKLLQLRVCNITIISSSSSSRSISTMDDLELLHVVQVVERWHQRVVFLSSLLTVLSFVFVGEDCVWLVQQEGQTSFKQAQLSTQVGPPGELKKKKKISSVKSHYISIRACSDTLNTDTVPGTFCRSRVWNATVKARTQLLIGLFSDQLPAAPSVCISAPLPHGSACS